jgi:hypothetical protein
MASAHRIAAALFALCVVLQWNDPDPLAWMAVYGAAALLAARAARGRAPRAAVVALLALAALWMLTLLPGVAEFARHGDPGLIAASMRAAEPWIEEAREFGGLGLIAAWCGLALAVRGSAAPAPGPRARP